MNWQISNMGSNAGNGVGAGDVGGMQQGNGASRPPATEYTLQGIPWSGRDEVKCLGWC
jgi:hypothetical protein